MIEINLLPVREAKRKADLRHLGMMVVLAVIGTVGLLTIVQLHSSGKINATQSRVRQLEADIERFKPQLAQVEQFRQKKGQVRSKLDAIAQLERARSGPVHMLDELAIYTPSRLRLTKLRTSGSKISFEGDSLDNELVAVFLRSLSESAYFTAVDLDGTKLGAAKNGLKLVHFTMHAQLTSPDQEKP